ncbi:cytochrome b/b6 domain-containing protein [Leptothrix discophora]|uniref:Cytochrome b/b6 domain-containing protein n=1 Tax=Leptothrix discophora TaxID=89 RepID=A0ABT9G7K4_LEPDI|nr:cytochrome b/b6 domain-containing protein [Leptothrix discophora]MDP4302452.1 cytochrome b/b6 domain-containing protein [Leptothrix discophora]
MTSTLTSPSTSPSTSTSTSTRPAPAAARTLRQRLVTDAPTRMFHALFALSFLGAYLTSEGEKLRALHVTLGYTMAGLLVARVLWGLMGPRHARLAPLVRKLAGVPAWVRQTLASADPTQVPRSHWQQGQNLALAAALLALMAFIVPLTASGWTVYNDIGGEWLEGVHEFFGNGVLVLVLAHLVLIALGSWLRGRNLAMPMLTGRTEGIGPDLVKRPLRGVAVLVLVAVLGWWAWSWLDSPKGLIPPGSITQLLQDED